MLLTFQNQPHCRAAVWCLMSPAAVARALVCRNSPRCTRNIWCIIHILLFIYQHHGMQRVLQHDASYATKITTCHPKNQQIIKKTHTHKTVLYCYIVLILYLSSKKKNTHTHNIHIFVGFWFDRSILWCLYTSSSKGFPKTTYMDSRHIVQRCVTLRYSSRSILPLGLIRFWFHLMIDRLWNHVSIYPGILFPKTTQGRHIISRDVTAAGTILSLPCGVE